MKRISQTSPVRPAAPHPLARVLRLAAAACPLLLAASLGFAQALAPGPAVHTYELLPGVVAKVLDDGSLVLSTGPTVTPLLSAAVTAPFENRRRRGPTVAPFTAVTAEGAPGGQRGFSAQRDDDQDGQVDEDPLDGVDNDGDGLLDEDYAAISEAMVVVNLDGRQAGGEQARLEHYHWSYPRLRSSVFVTVASGGEPGAAAGYRLTLGSRDWQEATAVAVGHTLAGQVRTGSVAAFVGRVSRLESVPDPAGAPALECDPAAALWLAVVVLSDQANGRPVLDGNQLTLPTGPAPVSLVICAAESWLQLAERLNEAARVWAGVSDQLTGQQAHLIVPPVCVRCRNAEIPAFSWEPAPAGGLLLTAHLAADCRGNLDPDLFRVAGRALGAPAEILWLPQEGRVESVPWSCRSAERDRRNLDKGHPYQGLVGLGDHVSRGRLLFRFAGEAEGSGLWLDLATGPLTGSTLDGRPFTAELKPPPPPTREHQTGDLLVAEANAAPDGSTAEMNDQVALLKTGRHQPTLAPALLEGYPNPFQDMIRLRFVVPATMGEAFVWEKNEDPPAGFDPLAAIPWQGGSPDVSVKIYSISGQELVTLFAANQGPGEGTLQWNGADSLGRQVASGTYFCKLQMDDWSVTRRLVYLR